MNHFYVRVETHPANKAIIRLSTSYELAAPENTPGYASMFFNTFVISPEEYEANFRTALGDLLAIVEKATQRACQWVPGKFVGAMHLVPLYKRPMS